MRTENDASTLTFEHCIWVQSIRTNKIWISHIHYSITDIDEMNELILLS